ncbi:MAG: NAD(P)/FAD-dependent oxidoreductase [Myxococcota bacterium]
MARPIGSRERPRIVIIGAGFAGVGLGIQLKKAGIETFSILEKSDSVGGTWRDNIYPGAACDSPSFAYCFSFEQKTDWSRKWALGPEILAYVEHCADKYRLGPHLRFGTEVESADFDRDGGVWQIHTVGGASAHLGMTVAGFPNFFMMYGPNTNLGHNSIIFMIECQLRYIISCMQAVCERNLKYIDVRADAMRTFNETLRRDLAKTVWAKTRSWYTTTDGTVTNNWSRSTIQYWWQTRRPDLDLFDRVPFEQVTNG